MNKTSKKMNRILAAAAAVAVVVLAAALVYFGYSVLGNPVSNQPQATPRPVLTEPGGQEKPQQTQGLDAVEVDLAEYTVYRLDELDFQFVIAKIRVRAEEAINIPLSHFTTSEGIQLDQIDSYLNVLDSQGLYVGKQNVWFELVSLETSYVANIFIPVRDRQARSVAVHMDFGDNEDLQMDLSRAEGTKEMLGYVADDIITDGRTYQMQVGAAFQIAPEEMYRTFEDGSTETAGLPSTAEVHVFRLEAVSLWGDEITVEQAVYETDSAVQFEALPVGFDSEKYDNILGKTIRDKDSGVLFFITYNPDREPITYQGRLRLKLQGQENWIEIQVSL